ncbi:unnamed protein product [Adineta steineri]|uniref:Chitin-binding type-2 domain-containing protein n=1 Tax=Adineta steineri TaxID=433720 RepID=A0A819VRI5_9BILA|nr:unnamed protein product [Adineta steineri]CAF0785866.1 unnamed protein product [Adineta steineri]CAF4028249.1 unnamed protein product [Adineta steineri]CAF4113199.1 unnamed protein product [Adineta steineri]
MVYQQQRKVFVCVTMIIMIMNCLTINASPVDPKNYIEKREANDGSASDFVCPEEDIINTECKGEKDCLYLNPQSCNSYIHCEVNADGLTGTPTVMSCAASLEWNDNTQECDWPENSTCPAGKESNIGS